MTFSCPRFCFGTVIAAAAVLGSSARANAKDAGALAYMDFGAGPASSFLGISVRKEQRLRSTALSLISVRAASYSGKGSVRFGVYGGWTAQRSLALKLEVDEPAADRGIQERKASMVDWIALRAGPSLLLTGAGWAGLIAPYFQMSWADEEDAVPDRFGGGAFVAIVTPAFFLRTDGSLNQDAWQGEASLKTTVPWMQLELAGRIDDAAAKLSLSPSTPALPADSRLRSWTADGAFLLRFGARSPYGPLVGCDYRQEAMGTGPDRLERHRVALDVGFHFRPLAMAGLRDDFHTTSPYLHINSLSYVAVQSASGRWLHGGRINRLEDELYFGDSNGVVMLATAWFVYGDKELEVFIGVRGHTPSDLLTRR